MAVTSVSPNTIYLGGGMNAGDGGITYVNDILGTGAITPGMLIELRDASGARRYGVHDTADDPCSATVALEQVFMNQGIDNAYADGDLIYAGVLKSGSMFYGIVASGANINVGDRLQSAGNGKLKAAATGDVRFVSHTDTGAVTADTRVRVEVL